MTHAQASRSDGPPRTIRRRSAFTLLELLVVVAVIGILVALTASAVLRYTGVQKHNNTQSIIRKIQPKLQAHIDEVLKQADKETIPPAVLAMSVDTAGQVDERRARVIYKKLRLRQEFPMNYSEACDPFAGTSLQGIIKPISAYREAVWRKASGRGTIPLPTPSAVQNSACLLMALTRARGGVSLNADELGAGTVVDTDDDSLQEIVDGWGQQIQFILWPYQLSDLNPGGPQTGNNNDTTDPEGLLTSPRWDANQRSAFQRILHPVPAAGGGSAQSYRLFPVIVSSGQNRKMGLDAVGFYTGNVPAASANDANDNLYNYNLFKLGATGN